MPKRILETERLFLRELVPEDAPELAWVLCDRENMRFYRDPFDFASVEAWIQRNILRYRDHGFGLWALVLKAGDVFIGDCGLVPQIVDGDPELEIGYHLNRQYQGLGYATEAAAGCIEHAFKVLGRARVISLIRPEHTASRRVAERNDMTVEKETIFVGLPHLVYVRHSPYA